MGDLTPELFLATFKCNLGIGEDEKTLWHVTPFSNGLSILQIGVWAGGLLVGGTGRIICYVCTSPPWEKGSTEHESAKTGPRKVAIKLDGKWMMRSDPNLQIISTGDVSCTDHVDKTFIVAMYRVDCESADVSGVLWDQPMRQLEQKPLNKVWQSPPLGAADDSEPCVELVSRRLRAPVPGAPDAGAHLRGPPVQTRAGPSPAGMVSPQLDAITVDYSLRRNDDNWLNLPIWSYQGEIPYSEGEERGLHWTRCFPFYSALWHPEKSKN